MHLTRRALLIVCGLALAACASANPAVSPRPTGSSPSASGGATPQNNRQLTAAETQRLLTLVDLPDSARGTTARPAALDAPAEGTPITSTLIDIVRYRHVDMTMAQAQQWITAHPPRGLRSSGQSQLGGPGGVSAVGFGFADERSSAAWTGAALNIAITPVGPAATEWRLDGLAEWLDPRPTRVGTARHPFVVSVARGCPHSDRDTDGVPPGPAHALLPTGKPVAALSCSYAGLNGRAFALTEQRRVSRADARRLAVLAARISLAHTGGGPMSCPADSGDATVIAFRYAAGTAELQLTDSGCRTLSNGTIGVEDESGAWARFAAGVDHLPAGH